MGKTRKPLLKIAKPLNAPAVNQLSFVKRLCSNEGNLKKLWGNKDLGEIPLELLHLIFLQLIQQDKNQLSESLIKGHKLSNVNARLSLRSVESAAVCWRDATPVCRLFQPSTWQVTDSCCTEIQTNTQASKQAGKQASKQAGKKKKEGNRGERSHRVWGWKLQTNLDGLQLCLVLLNFNERSPPVMM